jgi:hypothetical protein
LAGAAYEGSDPAGFAKATEYVSSFEEHVSTYGLPVLETVK